MVFGVQELLTNQFKRSLRAGCAVAVLGCAGAAQAATGLVTAQVTDASTAPMPSAMPARLGDATDLGAVSPAHVFQHLQLLLTRPAARQAALDALVAAQTDPAAPAYHRWLTPAQLRNDYGPASVDIDKVTAWLASHGLAVNRVSPTGMSIDFSGSSAAVASAFRTSLHQYARAGQNRFSANRTPSIPSALSPVVAGVTLSNFFPHTMRVKGPSIDPALLAGAKGQKVGASFTVAIGSTTYYTVTPADFATIYDLTQARNGFLGRAVTGTGQTIVVAEQTDINPADWNSFRSLAGLSGFAGTLQITHPGGCADPGFTSDEGEAALDAEWSSAVAPSATIVEAACAGTETTFGVETTLQNLVELGTPAVTISISYGGSEQSNGLAFAQGFANLIEEGASEGISIFVSAGDSASDSGDDGAAIATSGLSVNGLAASPYDTAIGGTDFLDTALGQNATYWSATDTAIGGSAKSYIPEIPWDNSCSNVVNYTAVGAKGPIVNCNAVKPAANYQDVVGGGGGQSLFFTKPDYQSTAIPGVPNDGVRDLPDVSLFAGNGFWKHFYLECMSDTAEGGVPCDPTNPNDLLGSAFGGTSFGAPDFAGIAALVAEYKGFRVGNMAPRLYQLAAAQYANGVLAQACLATKGNAISPACVFNDVAVGDNSVACKAGTPNCFTNANSTAGIGVLSTSLTKLQPAFPAGQGYDLATGLGTVNVTNLILNY